MTGLSPDDNWMIHYRADMASEPDEMRCGQRGLGGCSDAHLLGGMGGPE